MGWGGARLVGPPERREVRAAGSLHASIMSRGSGTEIPSLSYPLSVQTDSGSRPMEVVVDREDIVKKLEDLLKKQDLSRYVL